MLRIRAKHQPLCKIEDAAASLANKVVGRSSGASIQIIEHNHDKDSGLKMPFSTVALAPPRLNQEMQFAKRDTEATSTETTWGDRRQR